MAGPIQSLLGRLMRSEHLNRVEASQLLNVLLDDATSEAQIAAILIALKRKGETVEELAGLAEAMRARAVRISSRHERFIDTAGTGSSSVKTFNVSTAAAFVIAGAGLPVAKHGNRAASSNCGSADVLTALGVNVSVDVSVSEACLNDFGICFMFAPLYHSATARVAGVRRQLGVHTTFNLLGPLTNPAGAPRQVIGVWDRALAEPMARTLALLGTERAWVVHGTDGLDEVTLADSTFVAETENGDVRTFEIKPEDFGLERSALNNLRGCDAEGNAAIIRDVLHGRRKDEARALVVINAATALYVGGAASDFREASRFAEESVDQGLAAEKLNRLIEITNSTR